jgi:hypothetical protein
MKLQKYRATRYPVVTRVIDRTVVVTSPDFHFPIPVTLYLGTDDLSSPEVLLKIGRAVRLAYAQIDAHLGDLDDLRQDHPKPREPRETIPCPPKMVSLQEGCRLSGLKPDALRSAADQGLIKTTRTAGGHRRFERFSIEAYVCGQQRPQE